LQRAAHPCFDPGTGAFFKELQGMFAKVGMVAVGLVVLSAAPAFAQMGCSDPIAPTATNGATATEQQMKDAHSDVVTFMKSSDDYQQCLLDQVKTAKAEAAKHAGDHNAKPFDASIETNANARIDANQRLKEKVGAEFNAAVAGYKAAHPGAK
jgi:hypothetical protein